MSIWKKKNLLVADALRDEGDPEIDVTEEEAIAAETPVAVAEPVPSPPAAPAAPATPITMSLADLQAVMATVSAGNASLVDAVTQGIANAREPIPENKIAPGICEANPLGDRDHPRPGLKCQFTFGAQDPKTQQIYRTYPLNAEDLTVYTQIALNTLEPTQAVIKRLDGVPMKVSIVPERDPLTDAVKRMVIVVPADVMAKGSQVKNMVPSPLQIVAQITGRDYSTLTRDDLAWFMAEHRAQRYVAEREPVAV